MTDNKRFNLRRGHIELAKRLNIGWDAGCYEGAPVVDEKRPYGDSAVLENIAEILGLDFIEHDEEKYLSDETKKICRRWHKEMQTALEVILSTQSFEPGIYEKPQYGYNNWEQVYDSGE